MNQSNTNHSGFLLIKYKEQYIDNKEKRVQ